jgi:hypothetical protein
VHLDVDHDGVAGRQVLAVVLHDVERDLADRQRVLRDGLEEGRVGAARRLLHVDLDVGALVVPDLPACGVRIGSAGFTAMALGSTVGSACCSGSEIACHEAVPSALW